MPSYVVHNFHVVIQYQFALRPRVVECEPGETREDALARTETDGQRRRREHFDAMTGAISRRNPKGDENFGKLLSFCRRACRGFMSEMRVDWKTGLIEMTLSAPKSVDLDALADLIPREIDELAERSGLLAERGLVTSDDAIPGAEFVRRVVLRCREKLAGTPFAEPLEPPPPFEGLRFDGLKAALRVDLYPDTFKTLQALHDKSQTFPLQHPSLGEVHVHISSWEQNSDGRKDHLALTFHEQSAP